MRYRQRGGTEEEVLLEELVHSAKRAERDADTGAPEILPELLAGCPASEAGTGMCNARMGPLSTEALGQAEEMMELLCRHEGKFAVLTLARALMASPATKHRVLIWAAVHSISIFFNAFSGALMLRGQSWIDKSEEIMDTESFSYLLPLWLAFLLADWIIDWLQSHSAWELRAILQKHVNFTLTHALFTADSYYYLQMSLTSVAPETVICEDAFIFVKQLTQTFTTVLKESSKLCFNFLFLWLSYPKLLYSTALLVPVQMLALFVAAPYLSEPMLAIISLRSALHFHLSRVQSSAEQIALAGGGPSELHECERMLNFCRRRGEQEAIRSAVIQTLIRIGGFAFFAPVIWILVEDLMEQRGILLAEAIMYFSLSASIMLSWVSITSVLATCIWSEMLGQRMLSIIRASHKYVVARAARHTGSEPRAGTVSHLSGGGRDGALGDLVALHERDELRDEVPGPVLELRDVKLCVEASNLVLFRDLSLRLDVGESLLVIGETGIGKSTLLRCIQGLLVSGCGSVHRCRGDAVACVPQRPFMFAASLRENLLYPRPERAAEVSDQELWSALEAVNLRHEFAPFGLDEIRAWHGVLALGQQQRFAFARALLKLNTRLLLLDEATSALDLRNEQRIYTLLRERFSSYVSAAHRRSVQEYHTHVLLLRGTSRADCRSEACFMPVGQCDGGHQVSGAVPSVHSAATVEVMTSVRMGTTAEESEEAEASGEAEIDVPSLVGAHEMEGETPRQPSSMPVLMWRIFFDIVVPIAWRRSFWLQIRFYLLLRFLALLASIVVGIAFLHPFAGMDDFVTGHNKPGLWRLIFWRVLGYAPMTLFLTFAFMYVDNVLERITLVELQRHFMKLYFEDNMFYHLLESGRVQDPVGRLTMWDFTGLIGFYLYLVKTSVLVLGGNIALLGLLGEAGRAGIMPIIQVLFTYVAVSTVVYVVAFWKTYALYGRWIFEATRLHAHLVHIHGHAEAVALTSGGEVERRRAFMCLDKVLSIGTVYVWYRDYTKDLVADLLFGRVITVFLGVMLRQLVIERRIRLAAGFLANKLAWETISKLQTLTNICVGTPEGFASMSRVWELASEMRQLRDSMTERATGWTTDAGGILLEQDDGADVVLELRDVTLWTPTRPERAGTILLREVSMTLAVGDRLLITGPSGIGKSTLISAMAGLWNSGEGTVCRVSDQRSFFIAQRPYVCMGTLRSQVLYPQVMRTDVSTERIEEVLKAVQLGTLLMNPGLDEDDSRVDFNNRWWSKLSLGEMQRICFARLLLQEGLRVAFMDEATSALSPKTERAVYQLLAGRLCSYVSVAHRLEARSFHNRVLALARRNQGPAEWRMLSLKEQQEFDGA